MSQSNKDVDYGVARIIRYQGAIVKDHQLLLIQHREHESGHSYWLFPGGGIEEGETEEACVEREMLEETDLTVKVEHLLMDVGIENPTVYKRRKTYLCTVIAGEARPGYEPEEEARESYGIVEVAWFDLRTPNEWPQAVTANEILYPQLLRLQSILGY